jgi:hypothetical protein
MVIVFLLVLVPLYPLFFYLFTRYAPDHHRLTSSAPDWLVMSGYFDLLTLLAVLRTMWRRLRRQHRGLCIDGVVERARDWSVVGLMLVPHSAVVRFTIPQGKTVSRRFTVGRRPRAGQPVELFYARRGPNRRPAIVLSQRDVIRTTIHIFIGALARSYPILIFVAFIVPSPSP